MLSLVFNVSIYGSADRRKVRKDLSISPLWMCCLVQGHHSLWHNTASCSKTEIDLQYLWFMKMTQSLHVTIDDVTNRFQNGTGEAVNLIEWQISSGVWLLNASSIFSAKNTA